MPITIYTQPIPWILVEIVLFPVLWGVLTSHASKIKGNKVLNAVLLFGAIYVILHITLLDRSAAARADFVSPPFLLLKKAWSESREIFRSLFLNVLLFEPLGAAVAHLQPSKWTCRVHILTAVLVGLAVSTAIEYCQFYLAVGNAEVDDVICNTLGALIGALSLPIKYMLDRHKN